MGGMTGLLLLLCAGVTVGTVVNLQKRIVGGDECKDDERPYHVLLLGKRGNEVSLCGGSLITDRWILTAAHCWKPGRSITAYLGVHPSSNTDTQKMEITAPPESYSNSDGPHDIMLLQLPRATHHPHVDPPDCAKRPKIGDPVQVAGYGPTSKDANNQTPSPNLQCADIKVGFCPWHLKLAITWPPGLRVLYQHMFCGRVDVTDVCDGDSGGGVVKDKKIYGVISTSGLNACTAPAAFMDVCGYMDWINDIITRPEPAGPAEPEPPGPPEPEPEPAEPAGAPRRSWWDRLGHRLGSCFVCSSDRS